jgi:hypothetical protein
VETCAKCRKYKEMKYFIMGKSGKSFNKGYEVPRLSVASPKLAFGQLLVTSDRYVKNKQFLDFGNIVFLEGYMKVFFLAIILLLIIPLGAIHPEEIDFKPKIDLYQNESNEMIPLPNNHVLNELDCLLVYLIGIENHEVEPDRSIFIQLYDVSLKNRTTLTLFFKAYLRTTKNVLVKHFFMNPYNYGSLRGMDHDIVFHFGGGTNFLQIGLEKISDISNSEDFDDCLGLGVYPTVSKALLKDITISETLDLTEYFRGRGTNADLVIAEILLGIDRYGNDQSTITIYVYSEKHSACYIIHYFMNFSSANNNYAFREEIWHQLIIAATFWKISL